MSGGPTSGDGSGGGFGTRKRIPLFFGGTPAVGGGASVQNTISRASSFVVLDHNISRVEAAAPYVVFKTARGDWSTRRREEETGAHGIGTSNTGKERSRNGRNGGRLLDVR